MCVCVCVRRQSGEERENNAKKTLEILLGTLADDKRYI